MINIYKIFNIRPEANILSICNAFKNACLNSPKDTFKYTGFLDILINPNKKLMYDATLFHVDIRALVCNYDRYINLNDEEEYDLINFTLWLDTYKNVFYDLKYQTSNKDFISKVEAWYDKVDEMLENLKELISSIYLL